jgi:hypothetical protein
MSQPSTTEQENASPPVYDRWTLMDDATIPYGYLSRTGGKGIADAEYGSSYYITTAINYTNGTHGRTD